jgi:hypothetical protein
VIDSTGILYAQGTGHGGRVSDASTKVKHYRPDPRMFPQPCFSDDSFLCTTAAAIKASKLYLL